MANAATDWLLDQITGGQGAQVQQAFDAVTGGTATDVATSSGSGAALYAGGLNLDRVEGQQEALNRTGFGPLVVDGVYGPKSKAATIAFQKSRALVADAIWGPATKAAMIAALTGGSAQQKAAAVAQQTGVTPSTAMVVANNDVTAPAAPSAPTHTPVDLLPASATTPAAPNAWERAMSWVKNHKTEAAVAGGVGALALGIAIAIAVKNKKRR